MCMFYSIIHRSLRLFGLAIILSVFKVKLVTDHILYLRTFYHRAILIFLFVNCPYILELLHLSLSCGTLSILSFYSIDNYRWVGYVTGILYMVVGAVYFLVSLWTPKSLPSKSSQNSTTQNQQIQNNQNNTNINESIIKNQLYSVNDTPSSL